LDLEVELEVELQNEKEKEESDKIIVSSFENNHEPNDVQRASCEG